MEQAALIAQFPATADAQPPPPAANPSPGSGPPPPSHPSYAEMITEAILWGSSQGREGGSSKRAIAKYIDRVYTNLPPSHSALLTHHLKRLKSSGQLVMVKNSYQLSSAAPPPPRSAEVAPTAPAAPLAPVSPGPKKSPGRPPKPKPAAPISSGLVLDNGSGSGSEPAKKRRGRPPKQKQQPPLQQGAVAAEVPFVQPISEVPPNLVNGVAPASGQKKRGRPPKQQHQQQAPPTVVPFVQPVSVAAPVVHVHEQVVMAGEVTPTRRPGRPPKATSVVGTGALVGGVARSRGRPKKDALGPVSRPVGKRPRGRPKKLGGGVGGGTVGVGTVHGKRRGRPPKGSGPPKVVRRRTGKPVGRPRKDASTLRNHPSAQEGAANEELMRQFELIQSKIREAVAVIGPCVANEDAAVAALQQLEELATMDITANPTAAQAPPSPMVTMENMTTEPTQAVPLNMAPASTSPPPPTVTAPFMGLSEPFNVTQPQMTAPSGMESEHHPMSWIPSNDGRS